MGRMPPFRTTVPYARSTTASDTGTIAGFMNGVYAWMCVGLLLTAIVAWLTAHNTEMLGLVRSNFFLLIIAELALVLGLSFMIQKIPPVVATGLFATYAALNGLTLSSIFIVYELGTVGAAFGITAGMFGAMSLYGFITKKDLSGLGAICFMGLVGIIIASIVNIFFFSEMMYWIVTYAGVVIFCGLTAWDTQKLKLIALQTAGDQKMAARMTVLGALTLYLDFILLLIYILRIIGNRRS